MAEITKYLGIAIADAAAGRITKKQLLGILQDAIDNGDILHENNEFHVVRMFAFIDAGLLRRSSYVDEFEQRMSRKASIRAAELRKESEKDKK